MYPQSILDEIKDRLSISALIGERIPLKKAGRNFKGNCPFHSEKTPSFMVSDEKQIYHCFGCGEGGNIFNFFMKFDGLNFKETVETLANRAGVRLPALTATQNAKEDELSTKKKWAFRINEIVAEYYNSNLKDPQKGEAARNYLKNRDIFFEKNTQHFLGYADDSWDRLVSFLRAKNVPLELAAELGLVKKRDDGGYYDFFRHRIMFPVILPAIGKKGKTVAFSGRTFGKPLTAEGREEPAKYLNSPDSIIYHKSHTVFGLNHAAEHIRKEDFVVVVEGNLDVIRLHQEGIGNTVAPLGTALTSGHLRQLSRWTKNFVVIFDGDAAGRKASLRSLPLFLEEGFVPKVVVLKEDEDPDSFVRNNGAEALYEKIKKAPTLFEQTIDDAVNKYSSTTDGKVKTVEELRPYFAMIKNPVELAEYGKRLAKLLLLEESVVFASINAKRTGKKVENIAVNIKGCSLERTILEILLSFPETISSAEKIVDINLFQDESLKTIALLIMDFYKKTEKPSIGHFVDTIGDPELKSQVISMSMMEGKYEEAEVALENCARDLKKLVARRRIKEITQEISGPNRDEEFVINKMKEIQRLTKELHKTSC